MSSVAKSTPRNAIVEMLDYSSSNNDDVLEWWDGAHKSIASQNGTRNSSPRDATAEMQEDTLSDNDDNLECWDGVRKSQNCALLSGDHSFSLSPGSTKEKKGSVALKKDGPSFGNLDAAKEALDERRRVTFATAAASSSKRALEETASSSDADDDSSDCRVVERGRTSSSGSSFGQQGCTAGTTLDDAIRLLFSKDSDDDDEKHYGRTSNARKIEATTSPRKPALPNQIRGASTKNSLRVVPKVGRSARAMQHQNSIVSSSPTKPPSILSRDTTRNLLTSPEKKTRLLLFVDASFIEASPFIESSDPVSTSRSPQDHRAEPAPDQFPKDNDSDVQASCSQIDPCHGKNEMQEVPDEETQTAPQRECPDGSQASADVNFPDLGVLETLDKEWTKNASLSEGLEFEDRSEESPDIQQFIDMFSDDDDTKQDLLPVVELLSNELKDPDEFDLPAWMVCVDHLTKKTFRGTLPEWEFAVHGGDDAVLYYFRAFVHQSKIPGSGYGAFLEFLGGKRLNARCDERRMRLLDDLKMCQPWTREPLQAYFEEHGSGVTVRLIGQDLHGKENRPYTFSRELNTMYKGKAMNVKIVGEGVNDLPEYDAYYIGEESPLQPVGYLCTQIESEYVIDPTIQSFYSTSNCIDLGRYGPFRKEDRLPEDAYVLKSFIFSQYPDEWSFDTTEPLHGMLQMIDITCHSTGEPSREACIELPMYVNEIGHSSELNQNVWIRDSLDGRVVKYYFMAASPLRLGEPVELLTNYKCKYESVRERKGYGLRSINKGLCSDVIPAARMLRNFNERENVEWVVGMTMTDSIQRLCYLLRFVQTKIWKPLSAKIWQFNHSRESGSKCDPPTTLQWVASKRVVWLCHHIRQKLENFSGHDKSLFQFYEYKMNQCLDKIFREAYDCAVRSMVTHELGKEATEALEFENTEEGCYQIHDNLLMPLDSSLYCRIGSELIKTLCGLVDKLQFTEDKIIGPPKTEILKSFYDAAIGAKAEIWASIATGEFANLQFSPGVSPKSSLLSGSIGGVLKELRSSNAFFLQNSSAPKGVVAAAMRMLHYQDASILAGIEFDALTVPFPISEQVVMLRYDGVSQPIDLKGLGSIPVGIATMQQGAEINDMWYVATQVVWIVDVFAKHYLKGSGYSLVALCNVLDADKSHANFVTQRGLEKYDTYRFQDFLTRLDEVKAASCTDASLASARNPAKVNRKTQHKKSSKKSSKLVNIGPPTTTKVKTNANKKSSRLPPNRVYRGPPTSAYPAGGEWPAEWIQEIYERRGGASKGHQDSYWFPPSGKPKLRSTIDILRYLNSGSKDSFKSA